MIHIGRGLAVTLTLGMLGLPVAACTSAAAPPATIAASGENPNIVVAEVPTTSAAGLYIAVQRGFFKAAGLNVTTKPVVSVASVIPAMIQGSIQVEMGQWTSDIAAEASGVSLHALAAANSSGEGLDALVTPAGSKITSPGQLRGKTVLVNIKGGLAQMLAESVLQDFEVQPTQTRYVAVPFPSMAAALQRGDGDAAVLPEPFLTQAEEKTGVPVLADLNQAAVTNFPLAGFVATSSWVKKNPVVAAAFVRALIRGQFIAATNRAAVEQVLEKYMKLDRSTVALIALGNYPISVDTAQLDRVGFLMQKFGILGSSVNVEALVAEMTR